MRLTYPLQIAALTLLPLSAAAAQNPQPDPPPAAIINQQALDKLQAELRDMKVPQIDTENLIDKKALDKLQAEMRAMKIPQIDTENLINEDALHALIDSKMALIHDDPTLLALDMGGPFGQGGPDGLENMRRGAESHIAPPGMWWRNSDLAQKLGLTTDQQKHMDTIVLESRIQLVHMKASLEEEELRLEPMLNNNPPDTNKALEQINHIADTRADLEKANAKMLLSIRGVLSAQQWNQLQAEQHNSMHREMEHGMGDMPMREHKRPEAGQRRPEPHPDPSQPAPASGVPAPPAA